MFRITGLFLLLSNLMIGQVVSKTTDFKNTNENPYYSNIDTSSNNLNFYISIGKNNTTFDYKNSRNDINDNLNSSLGNVIELGVDNIASLLGLRLGLEFEIIDYNAIGDNQEVNFKWETTYIGINGNLTKSLPVLSKTNLEVQMGIGLQHILDGNQTLGNEVINLQNNNEFNGVFGDIDLGIGLMLLQQKEFTGGIFLSFVKSYSLDYDSQENLDFSSFQLKIRLCSKN
jgi:hypothetical protein